MYYRKVILTLENRFPEIDQLTNKQNDALFALLNREDVFGILPTGHGKSIIFQLLADFCHVLSLRGYDYPRNAIVLVICPLKSLIDSHIRELHYHGITATSLTGDEIDESGILKGKYSYVFASPEAILQNEKRRKMLESDVYRANLFVN
ncbi:Bloom syndrome protein homolog [Stylophora pistillata]|uniref:Bloom syndrome protein homolog n=1 Tax=Stylophora pistillata TaxID=50429 RepID=UPI000C03B94C|nr:Bloom syndrome protein homolog [Stylophora pistillata]